MSYTQSGDGGFAEETGFDSTIVGELMYIHTRDGPDIQIPSHVWLGDYGDIDVVGCDVLDKLGLGGKTTV